MNHLAHLCLARPEPQSRMGNLLGDFRRGTEPAAFPRAVRRGLENHYAVDRFTDQHPRVREARGLFSPARRRFAGVALDVLFDHFLLRHWERFHHQDADDLIEHLYRDLQQTRPLMPGPMQRATAAMVRQDRFRAYASLDTVGLALDRMAERIRFENPFAGIIDEIRLHERELEHAFLEFYPELQQRVRQWAIEARD